jgi:oxalate decarboxylase
MSELNRRDALVATGLAVGGLVAARGTAADAPREHQELPSFRYPLEQQRGRVYPAGSAKEATVRQLPISTGIAGVSMRLAPGGLRELHWHALAAEWAFVVRGRCRTTVLAPDGTAETNDFGPGDVWYFPRGHGHAVQGLGPEECHFLLVFDNGAFSEYGTFSVTDWMGHTPPEVLSKALGLPASAFGHLPREERYIVAGRVPPERPAPLHLGGQRTPALTHRYPLLAQQPHQRFRGGTEYRVSAREFPISTKMTGVILDLEAGALREPHWHPHANEWFYLLSGQVRATAFGASARVRTEDFRAGDVGYVPRGFGHYLENTGAGSCRILAVFDSGEYQEISLSTWLAANPERLVADNLGLSKEAVRRLPDHRVFVAPRGGPGSPGETRVSPPRR